MGLHFSNLACVPQWLQPRTGLRPITRRIPHLQLEQWPVPTLIEKLSDLVLDLAHVKQRESRLTDKDTKAIYLTGDFSRSPANAFIDDHEFCHLHPPPEGGVHLTLPQPLRDQAIALGWAEYHPLSGVEMISDSLVLVYAPRDEPELRIAIELVTASYRFASGV